MFAKALPDKRCMTDDELIKKSIEFLTGKGLYLTFKYIFNL